MAFIRLSSIKTTADVVSGILNWTQNAAEGWAGTEKSSSVKASASKTGALFGSAFLRFVADPIWILALSGCNLLAYFWR
jgi:hypothetical protein